MEADDRRSATTMLSGRYSPTKQTIRSMTLSPEDASAEILYSADRGLSGYVPAPLRAYSYAFDQSERTIWLKAEVDRELDEDEREDLSVAETGVIADNVLTPHAPLNASTMVELAVVVVPPDQPIAPLPGGIVFLRDGEPVPRDYPGMTPLPDSRARSQPHFRR